MGAHEWLGEVGSYPRQGSSSGPLIHARWRRSTWVRAVVVVSSRGFEPWWWSAVVGSSPLVVVLPRLAPHDASIEDRSAGRHGHEKSSASEGSPSGAGWEVGWEAACDSLAAHTWLHQ